MEEVEDRNGMQQLRQELNAQKVPLVDLTHKFGSKDTARWVSECLRLCLAMLPAGKARLFLVASVLSTQFVDSRCMAEPENAVSHPHGSKSLVNYWLGLTFVSPGQTSLWPSTDPLFLWTEHSFFRTHV